MLTLRATLNVQQNNALTSLGLTQLLRIGGDTIYLRDNIGLCLQNTVAWSSLLWNTTNPQLIFVFTLGYLNPIGQQIQQGPGAQYQSWPSLGYIQHPNCGLSF